MSKDGQKYGYRAKYKGNIEGSFCGLRGHTIHEAMKFAALQKRQRAIVVRK